MRCLKLIGLSILATMLLVPGAATMPQRIAPVVTIGGVPVPVEAQPRTVIEQQRGAPDRARVRLDALHGSAFARTIGLGDTLEVIAAALDGTSTPLFRGAVSSIGADAGGEGFIIVEASGAESAGETTPERELVIARGSGDARLVDFAPRLSAHSSVQAVLVTGILESTGERIVGRAVAPAIAVGSDSNEWAGATLTVETDRRFASIDDANALAQLTLNDLLVTRVSAEVLTDGLADIKAGGVIEVQGAGDPFDGRYLVRGVTHRFGGESYGGYSTALQVRRIDLGMFHHPEIDDEVLVAFEAGDLLRPYIVGSLWDCDSDTRGESSDDSRCRLLRWPW